MTEAQILEAARLIAERNVWAEHRYDIANGKDYALHWCKPMPGSVGPGNHSIDLPVWAVDALSDMIRLHVENIGVQLHEMGVQE